MLTGICSHLIPAGKEKDNFGGTYIASNVVLTLYTPAATIQKHQLSLCREACVAHSVLVVNVRRSLHKVSTCLTLVCLPHTCLWIEATSPKVMYHSSSGWGCCCALTVISGPGMCRVVVKLCPALPGGSVEHGEATFDSSSHLAVLSKLRICLPRMNSVRQLWQPRQSVLHMRMQQAIFGVCIQCIT